MFSNVHIVSFTYKGLKNIQHVIMVYNIIQYNMVQCCATLGRNQKKS